MKRVVDKCPSAVPPISFGETASGNVGELSAFDFRESAAAFDQLCQTFPDENCVLTSREILIEVSMRHPDKRL